MQIFSEKIEVRNNESIGRHLVAISELIPGEMILEEKPLLMTPHWNCEQMKCSNCFLDSFVMCKKCQFFPLCIDCNDHDAFDCEFFCTHAKHISKNLLVKNYDIFAALKFLLLLENPQTAPYCEILLTKEINLDNYRQTGMWREHDQKVIAPILQSRIVDVCRKVKVESDLLHKLCIFFDTNAFEVTNREGESLKGIFVYGAELPHNCVPNTVTSLNDKFQMKVYAAVNIKQGDVIYKSFVNPLMGTSQRQHHLNMTYNLHCACARCLDPTELGTHMSSLKCKNCEQGYANCDMQALKDAKTGNWVCAKCHSFMDSVNVRSLLIEVSEEITCANGQLPKYEELLVKYAGLLHPNHFLIIDIKQNIIAILRAMLLNPSTSLEKKALVRQVQLCEEVLPVVRAVVPGVSKVYAIALFEYLLPFLELAELEFEAQLLTKELYYHKLLLAKEVATKAANMLAFEPPNSPEGHLAQHIMIEQKSIEDNIQKFTAK